MFQVDNRISEMKLIHVEFIDNFEQLIIYSYIAEAHLGHYQTSAM